MSIKSKSKCSYSTLFEKEFPWSEAVQNDPYSFTCKLCNPKRSISLSNMGKSALTSHEKGEKHKRIMNASKTTTPLICNVTNSTEKQKMPTNTSSLDFSEKNLNDNNLCHNVKSIPTVETNDNREMASQNKTLTNVNSMKTFLNNDEVTEAETLWILQSVVRHQSLRDIESSIPVMARMFKDSVIASKIKLSKAKAAYVINYGISHYFKTELLDIVCNCDDLVIGFDETLNTINKNQQMDFFFGFGMKITKKLLLDIFHRLF